MTAVLIVAVLAVAGVLIAGAVGSGRTVRQADQSRLGTVVLVPGYGGSTTGLSALARALHAAGRATTVVSLPDGGTGDLTAQARTLATAVQAARAGGGAPVDVVGYSAGGVVARIWARDLGGAAQARRILTLGSPQHGTQVAALAGSLLPGACPTACQQLATDSPLLSALNEGDETPSGPSWVSLWTTADDIVVPADSASLAGATDLTVQSVCAGSTVNHSGLPTDPLVQQIVRAELAAGPVPTLGAGDCSRFGGAA